MSESRRRFLLTALAVPLACRRRAHREQMSGQHHAHAMPARGMPAHAGPVRHAGSLLHLEGLARFVDPLPIPRVLAPEGRRPDPGEINRQIPFYRITLAETSVRLHSDLPPTRMWGFAGAVPGPVIEARSQEPVLVEWRNRLPDRHILPVDHTLCGAEPELPEVRAVVHVHGARVPAASDGYPTEWTVSGESKTFYYPNRQDAALLWYHDHAMGIERLNQYAGLFGLFIVRDAVEDALNLPAGRFEVPLVLCDRVLGADGQLSYPTSDRGDAPWVSEVYGDAMLVNGKLFPYLEVEPRAYRFRVLNAANGRPFYLSLSNRQPFHLVGTDQGLLQAPTELRQLTLAAAERADLIVDFSQVAGQRLTLKSQAFELMQFRVTAGPGRKPYLPPARLRPVLRIDPGAPAAAGKTRTLTLGNYMDTQYGRMLMLIDGKRWHDPVSERPELDSVEIWRLVNLTEDTHPIHLHLVRFQVLDRQAFDADEYLNSGSMILGKTVPPGPDEMGWKDTVRAEPGMITRIIVRFEGYAGRYVWHCHLLEHAANEMMRPFEVVLPGGG